MGDFFDEIEEQIGDYGEFPYDREHSKKGRKKRGKPKGQIPLGLETEEDEKLDSDKSD